MSTIVEKIFSKKAGHAVKAGDIVTVQLDACMIHDVNGPAAIKDFREIAETVKSPGKILVVLDHFAPCPNGRVASQHKELRSFTKTQSIDLIDVCKGICHQMMIESGKIYPGAIVAATDSHTCSYGALNLFSTGIGATEAAIAMASDKCWFKVPETVRVELQGKVSPEICGKDIALELLRIIGTGGANYQCIEFCGDALSGISIDSRITICNMCAEVGAKGAIMPYDDLTEAYISDLWLPKGEPMFPDEDAVYAKTIKLDVTKLSSMVAVPPDICDARPVEELGRIDVDQVFLGSCTNGRYEDISKAAEILRGKDVHKNVRMIVIPASTNVMDRLRREGYIDVLLEAGASVFPPCCGPCAGLHMGLLGDNETVLSTSNRNLTGRMGSKQAKIYISSPQVAAYTALRGYISDGKE